MTDSVLGKSQDSEAGCHDDISGSITAALQKLERSMMPSELFLPWISVLSNVFALPSVSIQPLIIDGRYEEEIH